MPETMSAKPAARWLPLILLVALGALWGSNPTFSKALALEGVSPAAVVFWQALGAGVILLVICLVRGVKMTLDRKHIVYFLFIGVIGIDVAYVNLVFVVHHLSAGYVSVLILFSPMLTYLIALAVRIEKYVALRALGVLVGFCGAGFLVIPEGSLPSPEALPYALMAFITPAAYAAANVFAETGRPAGADNTYLAMGTMFAAAIATLIFSLAQDSLHPAWEQAGVAELLLFGYAAATAVAFLLFYTIIVLSGAVFLGQVGYLVTFFGVAWGALFFGETHSHWVWGAAILVFAGVALVNVGKGRTADA